MKELIEKMRSGELYDANYDPRVLEMIRRCEAMCYEYNHTHPSRLDELHRQLRAMLGAIGERARIVQPFKCDYGFNISVGEDFFANCNLVVLDAAPVTFGDRVFIGPNCGFYTAGHPLDAAERAQGLEYARSISVGNDVWIGGNVCVLPGASIGDGSVIGGGSVVTGAIPAGVVAVGNPCRVVRKIEKK